MLTGESAAPLLAFLFFMVHLASDAIEVEIAPEVGARIVSFTDRQTGYQFLWRNPDLPLRLEKPGTPYDTNFFGGIDVLMPNDMPETIAGIECPDHGEVWTTPFAFKPLSECSVALTAHLPRFDFEIANIVEVIENSCRVFARVTNMGRQTVPFMWKLHAALAIQPGDAIDCAAEEFTPVDIHQSRRKMPGKWEGETVPTFDGSMEFLYLHPLWNGYISWQRREKKFDIRFDRDVFPYAWYWASYGGFHGKHVAVLEPCTCMPKSVNEAHALGQCSVLAPGNSLETSYVFRGIDEGS